MGTQELMLSEGWAIRQSGTVSAGIFVSPEYLAGFALAETGIGGVPTNIHPIYSSEALPKDELAGIEVAVVEVRPDQRSSIARLIEVIADRPDLPIIAAISSPDVALVRTLVRQGVADVVSLPLDQSELNQIVLEVLARHADTGVALCPVVAVVKANGGCGATTTATQLIGKLADDEWTGAPPLLVDLDVQFGTAAEYLAVEQAGSILDLLQSTERLDDALVNSIALRKDGYSVLGTPKEILPLGSVSTEGIFSTIQFLRMHFGLVVLDLPSNWTDWSLSLLTECDLIALVSELSLHSLRQAKRSLDLFGSVGVRRDKVGLVLNKVEKKLFGALRPDDAARTLGCESLAVLPYEDAIMQGQQAGKLIFQQARKTRYAQELARLAGAVQERVAPGGGR